MNEAYIDYNNDNIVRAIEESTDIQGLGEILGPDNIDRILKKAVAVWVDIDGKGKKSRFEKQLDGNFFEWDTNVIFDGAWFRERLSTLKLGIDYFVE